MRVYLPAALSDIQLLIDGQRLSGRTGFALLPEWANSQAESDPEVLEEELVYLAGNQSLRNGQRIVLVADLAETVLSGVEATVQVGEFGQKQIQAMFGDDLANKSAILAGKDPGELDLTWFGPTEALAFKDFLLA